MKSRGQILRRAEFGEEQLVIGLLRAALVLPAINKGGAGDDGFGNGGMWSILIVLWCSPWLGMLLNLGQN